MTVQDVIDTALRVFPVDYELCAEGTPASFHEAKYLQLDSELARRTLSWESKISSTQAIVNTLTWWKEYLNNEDARNLCNSEIENYLNLK